MLWLAAILIPTAATFLVIYGVMTFLQERFRHMSRKQDTKLISKLRGIFYDKSPQQILKLYFILPPAMAIIALLLFRSLLLGLGGAIAGLFIPNMILKIREAKRRMSFNNQILDAIMILSSSLKGGLSLLQALEVLVEEMPPPMSQEMGLVVRENKMGVTLEDSLIHLQERMKLEELRLVINSILVARETGGDLTKVFSRLSTTIRDNRKLKDSIKTLTMQGRMQSMIMSMLPILFIFWVLSFNPHHFDIMFKNEIGRILLFAAGIMLVLGIFLMRKFSTIEV